MRLSPLHASRGCVGGGSGDSVPQKPTTAAQDPLRGVRTLRSVREYTALVLPCGSVAEVFTVEETLAGRGV